MAAKRYSETTYGMPFILPMSQETQVFARKTSEVSGLAPVCLARRASCKVSRASWRRGVGKAHFPRTIECERIMTASASDLQVPFLKAMPMRGSWAS
jgi:hypothetical protein